jgi:ABC-type nitrate/sulfonate/bicarbonate transport system permease component
MGAGRWRLLGLVDAPAALPAFFSGLTVAASYAMFGAIVAEWMGAERGLGVFINRSQESFRTPQIWAAVVLIGLISVLLVGAVRVLGRVATPWQRADARTTGGRLQGEPPSAPAGRTPAPALPWSPS